MGIDDQSDHPNVVFRSCRRRHTKRRVSFPRADAGNPPVRFDEREQETESSQTGLWRAGRKPSPIATGRLQPLRLFSTLLIEREKGERKAQSCDMAWYRQLAAITPVW